MIPGREYINTLSSCPAQLRQVGDGVRNQLADDTRSVTRPRLLARHLTQDWSPSGIRRPRRGLERPVICKREKYTWGLSSRRLGVSVSVSSLIPSQTFYGFRNPLPVGCRVHLCSSVSDLTLEQPRVSLTFSLLPTRTDV